MWPRVISKDAVLPFTKDATHIRLKKIECALESKDHRTVRQEIK